MPEVLLGIDKIITKMLMLENVSYIKPYNILKQLPVIKLLNIISFKLLNGVLRIKYNSHLIYRLLEDSTAEMALMTIGQ